MTATKQKLFARESAVFPTIPGMTSASLFPKAAAAAGISYGELCTRIAEVSLNQPRG